MILVALAPAYAHVGPRCLTPRYHETARASASFAEPDPYRPAEAGYVDSDLYPLRIHYRRDSDADRAATVVLPVAEESWRVEVEEMGWPAPPADFGLGGDDRYDLYLTNEETYGGAYTWGTGDDVDGSDGWFSQSSFIALDDRGIVDDDMPDFVSHEFNHALQYTIDGWEQTLFPWESTAEAMEDLVYDDTNLYVIDIPDFQELPWESLLFDGYSREVIAYDDYSYYEYGGSIWSLFLEQRYGANDGTTLLQFWEHMAQGGRGGEPDFVDAMGEMAGARSDFWITYTEFATWRMFAGSWDDGAHFEEGALWPTQAEVALSGQLDVATLDGTSITPTDAPYELGANYFEVINPGGDTRELRMTLVGEADARWAVIGAAWPRSGGAATVVSGAESVDLPLAGADRYMIGVANLGPGDLDPETSDVPRRGYTLSFALVEPTPDDTGGDDTGPGDSGATTDSTATTDSGDTDPDRDPPCCKEDAEAGCGCASGGAGASSVALALALAAVGRRRRG